MQARVVSSWLTCQCLPWQINTMRSQWGWFLSTEWQIVGSHFVPAKTRDQELLIDKTKVSAIRPRNVYDSVRILYHHMDLTWTKLQRLSIFRKKQGKHCLYVLKTSTFSRINRSHIRCNYLTSGQTAIYCVSWTNQVYSTSCFYMKRQVTSNELRETLKELFGPVPLESKPRLKYSGLQCLYLACEFHTMSCCCQLKSCHRGEWDGTKSHIVQWV